MNCKTDRSKLFIVLIFLNCQIVIEGEVTNEFICGWDTEHCDKQVFEFVVCVGSIFLLHKKQPNVDGFRSRMFLSSISYQDFFSNSTPPEPYQPFYTIFPFWLRKKSFRLCNLMQSNILCSRYSKTQEKSDKGVTALDQGEYLFYFWHIFFGEASHKTSKASYLFVFCIRLEYNCMASSLPYYLAICGILSLTANVS